MEISPNSETKPGVRRRLIQSTLFPHKSQVNVVSVDDDIEPDVDQEDDEEDYRGSQSQSQSQSQEKKNRKRKPKAVSQSVASRKLAVNGNEIGGKNIDEEDSPVTVKVDFFVKASERRNQKRKQKEQLPIQTPEKNEQSCSPPVVIINSKSPRKPRRRASATPKKQQTNVTPQKNSTPSRNAINSGLNEDYLEKMLASPPKPIPDLRLEAKITAEENSRIFAGKQMHPFFSSWKNGKKNMDNTGIENKWCHNERKDSNNDFSPVHIFEKTQGETFPLDWKDWKFFESSFVRTSRDPEDAWPELIYEGSVNCLQFDNFLDVPPLGISLCQNEGSSSQYAIQLEEISSRCCSMPQEKNPVISSASLVDKQEPHCNQLNDLEVVSTPQVHEIGKVDGSSESTEFVVKLHTQWQDNLLLERMTSNYHDCSYQPENSLWTTKYQPDKAIEICGNCESVKFLKEWLHQWHEKGSRTNKCSTGDNNWIVQDVDLNYSPNDCDSEYSDEETSLKNVLLVTGPVGSGKSAAIYACAKEQGFQVIEVNTSDWRNGALVKQKFGEAVESHWLQCSMLNLDNPDNKNQMKSTPNTLKVKAAQRSANEVIELIPLSDDEDLKNVGTALKSIDKENKTKTLILFEDVDATLYEDRGFIATIQQLAETAKRPMILTSNSDDPDLPNNLDRIEVSFRMPSSEELLSLAYMVCAAEKAKIEPCLIERFIDHCQGDIRKTIMLLQFWCQGLNQRKDGEMRNTYASLLFDTNAGHHVLPQMIPCGHTSKLSELIEKEITKSTLMAEKESSFVVLIEEEQENNIDSIMDLKETHSIDAKKDEMLRLHCSDQDGNDFPSFSRKTLRRKYGSVVSYNSEEFLNDELFDQIEDINVEILDESKRSRRKYNAIESSDSEEDCFNKRLCNNNNNNNINGICKSGDVSCVPESSYVPETEIGGVKEGPTSTDFTDATMPVELNNVCGYSYSCEEDKGPVMVVRDSGLDTDPVHREEIGDSYVEPIEALSREYQMMDECSRIDFSRKAKPVASMDFVQETWRKLRNCDGELRQYVSTEEKDALEVLRLTNATTNLISEADLLLANCQSLTCDYLKPSMVPTEKSHSFSWHDDQLQMASTIAQHGFCLYAKISVAAGLSAKRVDLAWEMLSASTNAISLGKLINQSKRMVHSSRPGMLQTGALSKSMLESPLCSTVQSIVPLRSQLSLKGYVFHEYLSSLAQISRSESSRLSEAINKSNQRRKRVARNYLSNGALALSAENMSLLDQYSCHHIHSSQSKDEN